MSQGIYQEMQFLYNSFFLGIMITFVYDNIRVWRRVIRHNDFLISLEDLLFWIMAAISIFLLQHRENNGVFRWFSIIGAFIGMLLYRKAFSSFFIKYTTVCLRKILKFFYILFSYMFRPIYFIESKIVIFLKKVGQRSRHALMMRKIRLTSYGKMIKMTLCKHKKRRKHEQKDSRT